MAMHYIGSARGWFGQDRRRLKVAVHRLIDPPPASLVEADRRALACLHEIVDDGTTTEIHAEGGSGLLGMRERAEQHGGELHAGHRTGGGFAVLARLPTGPAST